MTQTTSGAQRSTRSRRQIFAGLGAVALGSTVAFAAPGQAFAALTPALTKSSSAKAHTATDGITNTVPTRTRPTRRTRTRGTQNTGTNPRTNSVARQRRNKRRNKR